MTRRQALALKDEYSRQLLERPGVCGVGVATGDRRGDYVLTVFLETDETPDLRRDLDSVLQGIPFKTIVTGPFTLLAKTR